MNKTLLTLALALVVGSAQAVPLTDLLAGGSLTAGDKLFDQWTLHFHDASDGRSLSPNNIDVTALNDGGVDPGPGLRFDILNGEFSVTGDGVFAYLDIRFGFRASVLEPGLRIKDNTLTLTNGSRTDSGDNGIYIRETIGTVSGGDDLGIKEVELSWLDPSTLTSNMIDMAAFSPQREVWVNKNILVWATEQDETANLVQFEQRFSQMTVPEPDTLGLLALGVACLVMIRRSDQSLPEKHF